MSEGLYYIQDTRSYGGDDVLWWGPDRSGYTYDLDKAGVYTEEEAQKICRLRGTEKMWPKNLVDRCAVRHVPIGPLCRAEKGG